MLEPITIKEVYGDDGGFKYIELWQGSQHIKVSLAGTDVQTIIHSYIWGNLKSTIDRHQKRVKDSIANTLPPVYANAIKDMQELSGKKGE